MDMDFRCTQCGKCCMGLKLPLSAAEAVRWLRDGHPVEVLCEAIPWPAELPDANAFAAYKRESSFAAASGGLPIRVLATLVAPQGGRCPHLGDDHGCRIYERRPLVCRVYPAEINPFIAFAPARKACPAEAWQAGGPPLVRAGEYVDETVRALIQARRAELIDDVPALQAVCDALGLRAAAMANEGYVVHAPDPGRLLAALAQGPAAAGAAGAVAADWAFVCDNTETAEALRDCGADCLAPSEAAAGGFGFLSSRG